MTAQHRFWQGPAPRNVITRLVVVLFLSALLLASSAINVLVHWVGFPFELTQAACQKMLRVLAKDNT